MFSNIWCLELIGYIEAAAWQARYLPSVVKINKAAVLLADVRLDYLYNSISTKLFRYRTIDLEYICMYVI